MRRVGKFLTVTGLALCLVGCQQTTADELSFAKNNYQSVVYRDQPYVILAEEVDENQIKDNEDSFLKSLVVNTDTGEVETKSSDHTVTLAFNGVYRTKDDGLAIGVDEQYFKLKPADAVSDSEQRLDWKQVVDDKETDDRYTIDPNDARVIVNGKHRYRISDEIVDGEPEKGYLGVIAQNVTFDSETGKPLTKEELNAVDVSGEHAEQKRESWDYGTVYQAPDHDESVAIIVEINDEYHLAYAE